MGSKELNEGHGAVALKLVHVLPLSVSSTVGLNLDEFLSLAAPSSHTGRYSGYTFGFCFVFKPKRNGLHRGVDGFVL